MLVQKLLEITKKISDDDLENYLEASYSIYYKEYVSQNSLCKISKKIDPAITSNLIRFFRLVSPTYKIDEDMVKDIFKGKPKSFNVINEKISNILQSLSTRINFTDKFNSIKTKNLFSNDCYNNSSVKYSLKEIVNFSWKINLVISHSTHNKVLLPEIFVKFLFSDGSQSKIRMSIKMFQEFRKEITNQVKKIVDNERVTFLK